MLNWISTWIESLGYWGIFALMVLEHVFPPIPSEIIMPLSGFNSSRSVTMTLPWVIVAGTAGSIVGTLIWYTLGRLVSLEQIMDWTARYGRWLALTPKDIQKAVDFFQNRGGWIVGVGRVVPGVRTYVSVPAGLSHMALVSYLFYTTIGTAVWTAALAIAGYVLGSQFDQVAHVLAPLSKVIVTSFVIGAVVWVIYRRRRRYGP